jgi:cell division GTPase FtsZ
MKLAVIGFGQCGGRIADEFARVNKMAHRQRGIDIVIGAFAVNTDSADLAGLTTIKADYRHRILIGAGTTNGHGVAKICELGAELAKADADKIIDAFREAPDFFEADAFMVIGGAAGGTGSGATPVIAKALKERFVDKPVYAIIVLPFEHEEKTEERTPYNAAMCLKAIDSVADAVILVDNQRYIKKDTSLVKNINQINQMIVEPFYNLLCVGEEQKAKYIGAKILDGGDIKYSLSGWTTIGYGETLVPRFKLSFNKSSNFRQKGEGTQKILQAMDAAISDLSIECKTTDAGRALFLLTSAPQDVNVDMIKEISEHMKSMAPQATIRDGDYPRGRGKLEVTVVFSELMDVPRVRQIYQKSKEIIKEFAKREKNKIENPDSTGEAGKDVPSLL